MKTRVLWLLATILVAGNCLAQVEVVPPKKNMARRDTVIAPTKNIWHTVTLSGTGWDEFIIFSENNTASSFEVALDDTAVYRSTVAPGGIFRIDNRPATSVKIRSNGSATMTVIINSFRKMGF